MEDQAVCCYRHPDRETGVRCVRCDRPICPDCMVSASVGFQCPECVGSGSGTGQSPRANAPRTVAGGPVTADPRLVTKVLLGINLAVFIAVYFVGDSLVDALSLVGKAYDPRLPGEVGVANGEWYRLLTSMFAHKEFWHIGFNMLSLWWLGPPLEAALGRVRFLALFLLAGLGGNALAYLLTAQNMGTLGASGAIFGMLGGTAVLMRRLKYDMRPVVVLLALNLLISFTWSNISWQAHVGGLVVGTAVAYGMVHAPRDKRALTQWGTAALMLLAIAAVVAVRTVQLNG
ncbi:rhomboid family intramembrane serine protease [Streptomyces varsoviensis]|uniref:rhomboid family intramembrane serine protease n=1 Tax=Streptomyces varsoviensis TaxID=67373 RepID=UPI0004C8AA30|nr:rhomboid family intramembrane serine protease [Streptomyces varsoviensis]